jgi:excisionase family DNA binding protein
MGRGSRVAEIETGAGEPGPENGQLLTLSAAAERLHVSVRTVRRMIAYGYLPGYRVGPRVLRVHADDVSAALRRLPDGYADDDEIPDEELET